MKRCPVRVNRFWSIICLCRGSYLYSLKQANRQRAFMSTLSRSKFITTFADELLPRLPESLQQMQVRRRWSWLVQFHVGEPRLHYELSRAARRHNGIDGWEIGFHCEARDKQLNRYLLRGFRRHLFEIKDTLGDAIEAEMWDKGWTKIYEVVPMAPLTTRYQQQVAARLADIIRCLHPIYVDLRSDITRIHR